jgi:hypothetical protein
MSQSSQQLPFEVISDLPGMDDHDRQSRLLSMITGDRRIDAYGAFLDRGGKKHDLAKVHFLKAQKDHPGYAATDISGIDNISFDDTAFIYLEDSEGELTGWMDAREAIESSWHYGVIFADDAGQGWFFGRNTVNDDPLTADEPILKKISLDTPRLTRMHHGEVIENLPAEGEFQLTEEDEPHIAAIPWWSEFAAEIEPGDDYPGRSEVRLAEQEILEQVKARIAGLEAEDAPTV